MGFLWRDGSGDIDRGITDRRGGVSTGRYDSFNLADHVGDDPAAVADNRRLLAGHLGLGAERVVYMRQCHGARVEVVDGPRDVPPECDAVVTCEPDLALVVLVADCVPVLLSDPVAGVVAVVHSGRPGLAAGIVPATLAELGRLGARDVEAVVGPSVCGRCYEVPAPLRDEISALVPESSTVSWSGTPALDVAAGVVAQLRSADVPLRWLPGCSREHADLYSHREMTADDPDAATGRFAGVIVRRNRSTRW